LKRKLLATAVLSALSAGTRAAELPAPCSAGLCGAAGPSAWITSGEASATATTNALTVRQTTDQVVLNWQSFDISADGTVTFEQPGVDAVALNRIFQADPSKIFGVLKADGQVFLLNQNGIVFGQGATVNVGGLLASTLEMTPQALANGIAGAITAGNAPAFVPYADGAPSGSVVVEQGAAITTAEGGQVLMFAPRVNQHGSITTPGGQTMLAAGTTVYLAISNDDNVRGLLVEVGADDPLLSTVTNGPAAAGADGGRIAAERGNVTLAGLAVNQTGRVSATTSVRQNGTIRLQARTGTLLAGGGGVAARGAAGGKLTLGAGSTTEVTLVTDNSDTTVDANAQSRSLVLLAGADVEILDAARVIATGGDIAVKAQEQQAATTLSKLPDSNTPAAADTSRIYVAPGAVLDVSGADVDLPMERNVLRVELRGSQLRDSPMQRDGPLRGQAVSVDIRRSGTRADGTAWVGTPLADLAGDISAIPRSVAERNLKGGSVVLQSQGDVVIAPGSTVDVSGGTVRYADGVINTTRLLAANGSVVDIAAADRDRAYERTVSEYTRVHERWGVTDTFSGFSSLAPGTFERGYLEGYDAGNVTLIAPQAVFDGSVAGAVAQGLYQRLPTATLAAGERRPLTQLARGAQLEVGRVTLTGPQFVADPLRFGAGAVLPSLVNDAGRPFDPRTDPLPASVDEFTLRTDLFGFGRIAEANLVSAESIELAADRAITLPAGGALHLTAPTVTVDGVVTVPSGNVSITAQRNDAASSLDERSRISLGAAARIDVSGRWVNDDERSQPDRTRPAPLNLDGGSVSLASTAGDLVLASGSLVDVSAGAHRSADGTVAAGRGGTIALEAAPIPDAGRGVPGLLELGGDLRGYALADGGTLDITAAEICIAPTEPDGASPAALYLGPEFFRAGGFASYRLTTNRDGLTVAEATVVAPRQDNVVLGELDALRPSGGALLDFAGVATLDELVRNPADISLRVSAAAPGAGYRAQDFGDAPLLRLAEGSRIVGDADATIGLRANTRIMIDGSIVAPSGIVTMLLDETLDVGSFLDAQAIRLGDHATVDLRGSARIAPDALGARRGAVLDGGALTLTANRGYVVAASGSRIDVSGTSGVVDLRSAVQGVGLTPATIGSSAGTIAVTAAEGIALYGELAAHGGSGSSIAGLRPGGGTLDISLAPANRADPGSTQGVASLFPIGARTITLTQDLEPLVIGPEIPAQLNGQARIAANRVMIGGFDNLTLDAPILRGVDSLVRQVEAPGVIAVEGDVALSLAGRLTLRAARVDVAGGRGRLAAPYVAMGTTDPAWFTAREPLAGTGALTIDAGFLELTGRTVIDGAAATALRSSGDLRLRGLELPITIGSGLAGRLATAGDLTLRASQVYATTLSDFTVAVEANPLGVLTIEGNGTAPQDLLSAASRLRFAAPTIVQAGTVRAPFGSIELAGDSVSLREGSLTSTSSNGLTVPFGSTQGGFAWVYDLANVDYVYSVDNRLPPAQSVVLDGRAVEVAAGATIDISGGGDLLAYEFVPGVGGSRDVLSASVRPDEFAIVPRLAIDVAPYDQREYTGSLLRAGDNLFLEGGSGLPAGEYVLLPARYALLPGAFLVRAVDGYTDTVAGESFARADGSTVVAGYRALGGTGIAAASTRRTGFAVRPAELVRREAQYTTTAANEFFAAEAAAAERVAPRLPRDAGTLSLAATERLILDGALRAGAAAGGRGAGVDISSERLRVTNGGAAPTVAGEVVLDATSLNALAPESLLLGGRRTDDAGVTAIGVNASHVTIAAGASLAAPELLIAASDTLLVEEGARATGVSLDADGNRVTGTGAGFEDRQYSVASDAAFLRLSGGAQATLERSGGTGASGTLDVRAGAVLGAGAGSILLDTSRDTSLLGDLALAGGSLGLGASSITLGAAGVNAGGLVLTTDALARLDIDELVLASRSTVDLSDGLALALNRLTIDAAGLRGVSGGRVSLDVAEAVRFTNTANYSLTPTAPAGSLELRAGSFELGPGAFSLDGLASSSLFATGALLFDDGAQLTANGDLAVSAAYVTGAAGARGTLDVGGAFTLARSDAPLAAASDLALGARLEVLASEIAADGAILLPGGGLSLRARGDVDPLVAGSGAVVLGAGAMLDLRGQERSFDGVSVFAPGGRAALVAERGAIVVGAGATVDVSGAVGGPAGSVTLFAGEDVSLAGHLLGHGSGSEGGSLAIDALSFGGFTAAARAASGGFTTAVSLRQRGAGDLVIDETLRARDVDITAEGGSVLVASGIDASGETGGRVRLAAADSVAVAGTIDARATGDGQRGGVVELLAENGVAQVRGGAVVDVGGGASGAGGTVLLRLPRAGLLATLLDADPGNDRAVVAGAVNGARSLTVEAVQVYDDADGILTAPEVAATATNPLFADAESFMANDAALLTALGFGADVTRRIQPGIEIRSTGNLALAADWNLFPWRFGGQPGALTLRAAGDLVFNASLSDGFQALTGNDGFRLSTIAPTESWSYRLVGGANATSADPLAVRSLFDAAPVGAGNGDVRVGGGTAAAPRMVRTGTGAIEIAAANDFVLGNQNSVVYSAGLAGPGRLIGGAEQPSLGMRAYPIDGGDVSIAAGRHVRGVATDQFVTDWLWRVGLPAAGGQGRVAWTVNFARFRQNVAALGGGNLFVRAGGDITDFSASIPSIGRQIVGLALPEVVGRGTLDVDAGGSILGGSYYVGLGNGSLRAADAISSYTRPTGGTSTAPLLGLADSRFAVTARTDLALAGMVNPSLLPPGLSQLPLGGIRRTPYYSTYTDTAGVALTSVAGDLLLRDESVALRNQLRSMAFLAGATDPLTLRIAPPTLRGASLSGDVELAGALVLWPAPKSNLELFAQNNVRTTGAQVALPDTPITALPTVQAPAEITLALSLLTRTPPFALRQFVNAVEPVHADANQPDGVPDLAPLRIVAASGDVQMRGVLADGQLYSAKPVRVLAGRDLIDVAVQTQHLRDSDLSLLQAGRDVRYTATRDALGRIENNTRGIVVEGPGALQIVAGRDIDFQASQGVLTRGNLDNRFLPAGGASVSLLAGVGDVASLDTSAAVYEYLLRRPSYADAFLEFVRAAGGTAASMAQAATEFGDLDEARQREFFESLGLTLPANADYVAVLDTYLTTRASFDAQLVTYVQNHGGAARTVTAAAIEFMALDESLRSDFFASIGANAGDDFARLEEYVLAPARAANTLLRYVNAVDNADEDALEALGVSRPPTDSSVIRVDGFTDLPTVRTLDEALALFRNELTVGQRRGFFVSLGVDLPAQPDYAALVDEYVVAPDGYATDLVAYVRRVGGAVETRAAAFDEFLGLDAARRRAFLEPVLFDEIRAGGRTAAAVAAANRDFSRAFDALESAFPGSLPDSAIEEPNTFAGGVQLFFSRVYTLAGGDISLIAPGGEINVGLAAPPIAFGIQKSPSELGIVVQQTGNVSALAYDDFLVNESRVFAADGGNILVWSTESDIDAGRGAKTAISAPPPTVTIDENGRTTVLFPAALTGSGIQTLATTLGRKPGNVDLFAPRGVVNAGDAGIVAGNLTIAATAVLGADNISVSGDAVGVPVDTGGFAAALTGVSAVASSASNAAADTVGPSREAEQTETPLADQALGFLDVFITGFGDPDQASDEEDENEDQE
jgi:filamentous hemagglutinin family protein